jgi:hypothetical protein
MAIARRSVDNATGVLLTIYVALAVAQFGYAVGHAFLSPHRFRYSTGVIVGLFVIMAAISAVLLVALVHQRHWAWVVLLALGGLIVISYSWESGGVEPFVAEIAGILLLLSPPIRRHVRRRGRTRGPTSPTDGVAAV